MPPPVDPHALAPSVGDAVADLAVPAGPAAAVAAPPRVALARSRAAGSWIALAIAAFGGLFALVRAGHTHRADVVASRVLQRRGRRLEGLFGAVSWPGFPPQSWVLPSSLVAALWAFGLRLEAVFQLVAWSSALLSSGLKALARRPRPAEADAIEVVAAPLRDTSFPSGHVLTYVGVYGFFATLVGAHVRRRRVAAAGRAALLGLVALVGPSRVQQGHHWPSDVIASYLVGLPFLALLVEAYRATKARLLEARP